MRSNLPTPASALAIGAHPDDVEFGCGGTLAKWIAGGCVVHHLICTDGSKGSWDAAVDRAELVVQRQREQRDAAASLGATGEVIFLGRTDGELGDDLETRAEMTACIRRLRPDVILGHDPWRRYRLHPDHRHAGFLTLDAIVAARDPHFFPDQGHPPHRPSALLLFEADAPDLVEDITGYLDIKVAALLRHRSQLGSTMGIEDAQNEADVERFRRRIADEAAGHGRNAGVAYGEPFKLLEDL